VEIGAESEEEKRVVVTYPPAIQLLLSSHLHAGVYLLSASHSQFAFIIKFLNLDV
jgi:hypothetical protein